MARQNLAVLYTRQRRLADAGAVLSEAARVSPDSPVVLVSLGRTLLDHGMKADAAVVLERAVGLAPSLPDARFWLARVYLAAGEAPRATAQITALERLDPTRAAELRRELR